MQTMQTPFGNPEDLVFAEDLWKKLQKSGFINTYGNLYLGGPPHGKVREVNEGVIDGRLVIVKNNYGGKNISLEKVRNNPAKYLKAVTVMVKRPGYDPEDQDWFWIKYAPDGTVMANKKGRKLAGRVAKGKPIGCISCHRSASGNDFVFSHNKTVNAAVTWIGKEQQRMMTLEKMMNP
ncbi:cytochrome P460 family protein [Nitratifractor sp.]